MTINYVEHMHLCFVCSTPIKYWANMQHILILTPVGGRDFCDEGGNLICIKGVRREASLSSLSLDKEVHIIPTTPVCTWWNRPEEEHSSGKSESTNPSRTIVKSIKVFYGVESVVHSNADSLLN